MNEFMKRLSEVANRRGWDMTTQAYHLCQFLEEVSTFIQEDQAEILEEWESYLEDAEEDEDKQALNDEQYAQSLEEDGEFEKAEDGPCPDEGCPGAVVDGLCSHCGDDYQYPI